MACSCPWTRCLQEREDPCCCTPVSQRPPSRRSCSLPAPTRQTAQSRGSLRGLAPRACPAPPQPRRPPGTGCVSHGAVCWYPREGGHCGQPGEDAQAGLDWAGTGEWGGGGQPVPAAELSRRQAGQWDASGQVSLGADEEAGGLSVHVVLLQGGGRVSAPGVPAHALLPGRPPGRAGPCLIDASAQREGPGVTAVKHQAGHITGGVRRGGQQAVRSHLAQLNGMAAEGHRAGSLGHAAQCPPCAHARPTLGTPWHSRLGTSPAR